MNKMNKQEIQNIIKAGEISKQVKLYAKKIIKKDMLLLEIAEKIENKIHELGGKIAFPTNLSINEIAAHYTPSHDDETKAKGLLKVDVGVHVDGYISDSAFSLDLEGSEENKKLIQASRDALENIEKSINPDSTLGEIGEIIEKTINNQGYNSIVNLSGHSMEQYNLHAGVSIPNINNKSNFSLGEGLFAVEPFATTGTGKVKDSRSSGIYQLENYRNIRSPIAKEVLKYIAEEYTTLPFCSRWLVKKFGTKALLALRQLENQGIIHHFAQLIESSGGLVSQAENTFLIQENKTIITTKDL